MSLSLGATPSMFSTGCPSARANSLTAHAAASGRRSRPSAKVAAVALAAVERSEVPARCWFSTPATSAPAALTRSEASPGDSTPSWPLKKLSNVCGCDRTPGPYSLTACSSARRTTPPESKSRSWRSGISVAPLRRCEPGARSGPSGPRCASGGDQRAQATGAADCSAALRHCFPHGAKDTAPSAPQEGLGPMGV
jgi:hypothetical protein